MIPVFRPQLDPDAVWQELRPVLESGWLGLGPKVAEFERVMAQRLGTKHFVATSSCTAALHLAVKCLNLTRSSAVLTSPITFVSTNAALLYENLWPVFGAVDSDGMLVCADETRPAIIVHLGGAECRYRHLRPGMVIEDCAHAFGAPWLREQRCAMRCWSFHAVKNLALGDGGGISTNDDCLAERLRHLRWMGIDKSTHERTAGREYVSEYDIPVLGYKYHMNDITAAIGLAALRDVDRQNRRRREIAWKYAAAFPANCPSFTPDESSCHFYPLFFDQREEIERRLHAGGVAYSRHYQPNYLFWPFTGFTVIDHSSAMRYWRRVLVLPIFPAMTDGQIEQVIAAVRG